MLNQTIHDLLQSNAMQRVIGLRLIHKFSFFLRSILIIFRILNISLNIVYFRVFYLCVNLRNLRIPYVTILFPSELAAVAVACRKRIARDHVAPGNVTAQTDAIHISG
jgi:hypothetical protein